MDHTPSPTAGAEAPEHRAGASAGRSSDTGRTTSAADFLAEASRVLGESIDFEETIAAVAAMALPYLGSWCILDLTEPDGSVRRARIVHPDPRRQAHARRLTQGWPPKRDDPLGMPSVARTRRPEIIPEVTDDMLVALARSEDNLLDLRTMSMGSVLSVPLIAHDDVLGAITFVSGERTRYGESDVALAEALASRCALALRSARLHGLTETARATSAEMNERLVLACLRDQDLADAATRAVEAKSRLLAAISHEFRTPLAAIEMTSRMVADGITGPVTAKQLKSLRRIEAAAEHLDRLVADIFELTKLETGPPPIRARACSMSESVSEAVAMMETEAAAAGVVLEASPPSTAPSSYEGDPDRVRQILLNVVANAVHFTPRGGRVTMSYGEATAPHSDAELTGSGPWVFVAVQDTGIGIAPAEATELFEPFAQGKAGRARSRDGTGLGLAISRQLARRMDGDLTLRSIEGEGSTFTLWLPRAATTN